MKIDDPAHPQVVFTATLLGMLDPMSPAVRAAFGASCAERLYPLYDAFIQNGGTGDPAFIRHALDDLWILTVGSKQEPPRYKEHADRLLSLVPRLDANSPAFTFAAQYAVSCIIHAYRASEGAESEEAIWCSVVSRDCLTEYLTWLSRPVYVHPTEAIVHELDQIDWFDQPLVQHEIRKQTIDLQLLSTCRRIDDRIIHRLRTEGARGIDPVARGLSAGPGS